MKTFKDSGGREWRVVVNVKTAKQVRDLTGVDLFNIFKADGGDKLFSDVITLVNVLYVLLKPQVDERKMSEDDFALAMFGDTIEAATSALARETADFFPASQRAVLNRVLDKSEEAKDAITASALAAIDAMDLTTLTSTTQP